MALQNSTSAVWPSCGRCALILLPVTVTWERQTTIPPLATTQLIIDPNDNTTSTSIDCNSGILDQFYNFNDRGGPATLPWQTYDVDQNCNLIGGAQGALQPTGTQADRIPMYGFELCKHFSANIRSAVRKFRVPPAPTSR